MAFVSYSDVIKANRRKTKIVIFIYLCIYLFLGSLVDVVLLDQGSLMESLSRLVSMEVFPIATAGMVGMGLLTVFIAIKFFKRIQLAGEEYLEVDENNLEYRQLYNIMEELKLAASMNYMPKIYIIEADYMNAFASGWSEDNTMVAITRGLLSKLNREEIAAVMAHELSHIRNEDIKLTLVIGVATNLMLFVVDWIVLMFLNGKSEGAKNAKMILWVMHFILPLLTIVLQMWLSRSREYMADAGAVELIRNPEAMASALRKISGDYEENKYDEDNNETRKAAYIFQSGDSLFSTHPAVKNRIEKLIGKQ